MSEKQFRVNDLVKFNYSEIGKYVDENHTDTPLRNDKVCNLLNKQQVQIKEYEKSLIMKSKKISEQQATIQELKSDIEETEISIKLFEDDVNRLSKENEQLRQQIQNYEKLISNSYVGEEETLDGFVGKYVIWENELQKYKEKIKKVIDDE